MIEKRIEKLQYLLGPPNGGGGSSSTCSKFIKAWPRRLRLWEQNRGWYFYQSFHKFLASRIVSCVEKKKQRGKSRMTRQHNPSPGISLRWQFSAAFTLPRSSVLSLWTTPEWPKLLWSLVQNCRKFSATKVNAAGGKCCRLHVLEVSLQHYW